MYSISSIRRGPFRDQDLNVLPPDEKDEREEPMSNMGAGDRVTISGPIAGPSFQGRDEMPELPKLENLDEQADSVYKKFPMYARTKFRSSSLIYVENPGLHITAEQFKTICDKINDALKEKGSRWKIHITVFRRKGHVYKSYDLIYTP